MIAWGMFFKIGDNHNVITSYDVISPMGHPATTQQREPRLRVLQRQEPQQRPSDHRGGYGA